jgi:hypothetical protein
LVLRILSEFKRDEITRRFDKLHDENMNKLNYSSHIIRIIKSSRMRLDGHVACMRTKKKSYMVLVGKSEKNWAPGRSRCR